MFFGSEHAVNKNLSETYRKLIGNLSPKNLQLFNVLVAEDDFFEGHYTTAIEPGEILIRIDFPVTAMHWAFDEVARRPGDFALGMAAISSTDKLMQSWQLIYARPLSGR